MNKRETIRVIRNVVSGAIRHDSARIIVLKKGYDVYTSTGLKYSEGGKDGFVVRHDRNSCTLREARGLLDYHELVIDLEKE